MKKIYLQSLILWFIMVVLAILNGILRESVFALYLTELRAHQLSTVSLICLFSITVFLHLKLTKAPYSVKDTLRIGGLWVTMTIIFEFIFGHFVMGHEWSRLFNDYNILEGRVWSLVLIATLILPYVMEKLTVKKGTK